MRRNAARLHCDLKTLKARKTGAAPIEHCPGALSRNPFWFCQTLFRARSRLTSSAARCPAITLFHFLCRMNLIPVDNFSQPLLVHHSALKSIRSPSEVTRRISLQLNQELTLTQTSPASDAIQITDPRANSPIGIRRSDRNDSRSGKFSRGPVLRCDLLGTGTERLCWNHDSISLTAAFPEQQTDHIHRQKFTPPMRID